METEWRLPRSWSPTASSPSWTRLRGSLRRTAPCRLRSHVPIPVRALVYPRPLRPRGPLCSASVSHWLGGQELPSLRSLQAPPAQFASPLHASRRVCWPPSARCPVGSSPLRLSVATTGMQANGLVGSSRSPRLERYWIREMEMQRDWQNDCCWSDYFWNQVASGLCVTSGQDETGLAERPVSREGLGLVW